MDGRRVVFVYVYILQHPESLMYSVCTSLNVKNLPRLLFDYYGQLPNLVEDKKQILFYVIKFINDMIILRDKIYFLSSLFICDTTNEMVKTETKYD